MFFLAFSTSVLTPSFPGYLSTLGAHVAAVGIVIAMYGVGQVTSDLPGGLLIARFGIVPVAFVSSAVSIATNVCLHFVSSISAIGGLMFLSGFFASILITTFMAFIRSTVDATQRGRALAGVGGALRLGMLGGPIAGGFIAENFGVPVVFLVRAICFGAVIVATTVSTSSSGVRAPDLSADLPSQKETAISRLRAGLRGRWFAVMTVGFVILSLTILRSSRQIILPLWGESIGLSPSRIGVALSIGAAFDLLLFVPSGVISDRYGRKVAATICLLGFTVGLGVLVLSRSYALFILAIAVVGLGNGFGAGINMTTGADLAPTNAIAEFLGIWRLYGDIGAAIGPALVGAFTAVIALGPTIGVIAAIGVGGAVVMAFIAPETRDIDERSATKSSL